MSLDRNMLDNLPVFDQDYVAAMSQFLDPGSVGAGGITLVVDGMEQSSIGVSASAIQEVKINQNPYAAEFARPGTRAYRNHHEAGLGEIPWRFQFSVSRLPVQCAKCICRHSAGGAAPDLRGQLDGPLGHGHKTSFLVTADHEEDDLQAVVFASGPAGVIRQNVANPHRNSEYGGSVTRQLSERHVIFVRGNYREGRNVIAAPAVSCCPKPP